jgi:hypothetical protein
MNATRYIFILRARKSDIPPEIRLRRGLKYLDKACDLDCEEARPAELAKEKPKTPGTSKQ